MPRLAHTDRPADQRLPASSEAFDPARLEEMRAILGQGRLDELLDLLAAELEARPRLLRGALADHDLALAAAEAHGLKGVAANFGATSVAAAARSLEQAISASSPGDRAATSPALLALTDAASDARNALAARQRSRSLVASRH
jgi:HPt (histidine-containing phosphotransfer) domain-containing protein